MFVVQLIEACVQNSIDPGSKRARNWDCFPIWKHLFWQKYLSLISYIGDENFVTDRSRLATKIFVTKRNNWWRKFSSSKNTIYRQGKKFHHKLLFFWDEIYRHQKALYISDEKHISSPDGNPWQPLVGKKNFVTHTICNGKTCDLWWTDDCHTPGWRNYVLKFQNFEVFNLKFNSLMYHYEIGCHKGQKTSTDEAGQIKCQLLTIWVDIKNWCLIRSKLFSHFHIMWPTLINFINDNYCIVLMWSFCKIKCPSPVYSS